ncbi:MAG: preprotein translocase subunit SecG [Alphaproteobacteria bacterium]|nr:preprotein translocase subunit SecG [Alphaproteobacteria bacterium]
MEQVVLVIHLMLALAIIGLVLIQRSEGGGLGIGGGGLGQFASARATANVLTRATAVCAGCFFVTSLTLAWLAGTHTGGQGILENLPEDKPAAVSMEGATDDSAAPAAEDETQPKAPSAPISN